VTSFDTSYDQGRSRDLWLELCAVVCGGVRFVRGTSLASPRANLTPAHNYRPGVTGSPGWPRSVRNKVAAAGIMLGPCQLLAHGPNGVSGALGGTCFVWCESSAGPSSRAPAPASAPVRPTHATNRTYVCASRRARIVYRSRRSITCRRFTGAFPRSIIIFISAGHSDIENCTRRESLSLM